MQNINTLRFIGLLILHRCRFMVNERLSSFINMLSMLFTELGQCDYRLSFFVLIIFLLILGFSFCVLDTRPKLAKNFECF